MLGSNEAHVWFVVHDDVHECELRRYQRLLDDEETARWQQFLFARDRRDYLVAHALVRTSLSRYADVAPGAWRFRRGEFGRPEIAECATGSGLRFNMAHTRGLSIVAVTRHRDIGVDAEWMNPRTEVEALAGYVFARTEEQALLSMPASARAHRFFELWALKEAYIKARGLGLQLPLDRFSFDPGGAAGVKFQVDPELADEAGDWQFELVEAHADHRAAVAVRTGGERIDVCVRRTVPLRVDEGVRDEQDRAAREAHQG